MILLNIHYFLLNFLIISLLLSNLNTLHCKACKSTLICKAWYYYIPGTIHPGHEANNMLSRKNGAQHRTNVKNTNPSTFVAFCSLATAFADNDLSFLRLARNLSKE